MGVCGVIAEFNPFHTGHAHLLQQARHVLGTETTLVCAMSGNFVQRGEAAFWDKYDRAEAAVRCGADLVLETPLAAVLSSAEGFARGAVGVLAAAGCDTVAFGCECGDGGEIARAAALLDELDFTPARHLSYAAARQAALRRVDVQAAALLDAPNNTLAIEYCRAMRGTALSPLAIPRRGAAHDAAAPESGFASASLLRQYVRQGNLAACAPYLPPESFDILTRAIADGRAPAALPDLAVLALLRAALDRNALATGSADGFDERLAAAVYRARSFSEAVSLVQTRRFPAARVRRALLRAALGLAADAPVRPSLLRVLAVGARGRVLLRRIKQTGTLPLVTKPVAEKRLPAALHPALSREVFADDLFALSLPDSAHHAGGAHFRGTPFCVK